MRTEPEVIGGMMAEWTLAPGDTIVRVELHITRLFGNDAHYRFLDRIEGRDFSYASGRLGLARHSAGRRCGVNDVRF